MPRAKDRPILFEVIDKRIPPRATSAPPASTNRATDNTAPPPPRASYWRRATPTTPAATSAATPPQSMSDRHSGPPELDSPARAPSDAPRRQAETTRTPTDPAGPDVDAAQTDAGASLRPLVRWNVLGREIALTWVGLTGIAAGLLVAFIAIYQIGTRISGDKTKSPAKGDDPINVALNKPADSTPLNVPATQRRNGGHIASPPSTPETVLASDARPAAAGGEPRAATEPEPAGGAERKKGYHYVVVQHFQKSRAADAQAASKFLQANGIGCTIVTSNADVRLIATEPFLIDQKDKNASGAEQSRCNELKRRVRELGKQYARTGRYAFEQCYQDKN